MDIAFLSDQRRDTFPSELHGLRCMKLPARLLNPHHYYHDMSRTRFLITGGLGFIGSAYVRKLIGSGHRPLILDLKTYAGDERRLSKFEGGYELENRDVADPGIIDVVSSFDPEYIVHFAAESHVTRGESRGERFWQTNVDGTENLLRCATSIRLRAFVHVSTDEIYGPCLGAPFNEEDKLSGTEQATSAYAKSKAEADDVAMSFRDRVPVIVMRPTNCFGPWQHPEKAIPRWICRAINGKRLPVWGSGRQKRSWLYVDDVCDAISIVIDRGAPGNAYNAGPDREPPTNLEVAQLITEMAGDPNGAYLTAYDRPDHDVRYAVVSDKLRDLGWMPRVPFANALSRTFEWYRENEWWWLTLIHEAEKIYEDSDGCSPRGSRRSSK